jgi:hypothetical protein
LFLYVANGVLGVQFLNADAEILAVRERVATTGESPCIDACMGPVSNIADSLAAEGVLDDAAQAGFDCIKIYDDCSAEALRVLARSARSRGMRTVGHIPRNLTWQIALAARPSAIAHAEEFLYSPIRSAGQQDSLVQGVRAGNIAVISTLTNYDLIGRQPVELAELLAQPELVYYSPIHRRTWGARRNHYVQDFPPARVANLRRLLGFQRRLLAQIDAAGGRVLVGTDAGNNFVLPGWSVHDELEELALAGMSPYAVLRAATFEAAAFLGHADRGTVAVGKRADLVLLHGNPLTDIGSTRLIAGVLCNGRWLSREEIRRRLDAVRDGFAVEERLLEILETKGLNAALRHLSAEQRRLGRPPVGVVALNELGYQYWKLDSKLSEAKRVFEMNARLYPKDSIATGSLADFRTTTAAAASSR